MTDKEKIREEIARINLYSRSEVLEHILKFIDSLPEEPVSEDLEEAAMVAYPIKHKVNKKGTGEYDSNIPRRKAFIAGANWQKQQLMKQLAHMPWDEALDYIVKETEP